MNPHDPLSMWLLIVLTGLGTYALRLSFLATLGDAEPPERWVRVLRYVPVAVLSALVVGGVLIPGGERIVVGPELGAAAIAALVAWRTRSVVATITLGMVALWCIRSLPL